MGDIIHVYKPSPCDVLRQMYINAPLSQYNARARRELSSLAPIYRASRACKRGGGHFIHTLIMQYTYTSCAFASSPFAGSALGIGPPSSTTSHPNPLGAPFAANHSGHESPPRAPSPVLSLQPRPSATTCDPSASPALPARCYLRSPCETPHFGAPPLRRPRLRRAAPPLTQASGRPSSIEAGHPSRHLWPRAPSPHQL